MLEDSGKKQKILIRIFVLGLIVLFVARDICGLGINKYVYLAFSIVCFCLAEYETMLYMVCFLLPLFNGLPGTYIVFGFLVLLLIKRRYLSDTILILILAYLMLEMFAYIWYPSFPRLDIPEIIEYIGFLSLFFILLYDDSEKDKQYCLNLFFTGVLVFCLVVVISGILTAPENWIERFSRGGFRFGTTNTGSGDVMMLRGNPNELAYLSISGIAVGLTAVGDRTGIKRILTIVAMVLMGIAGFLSVSRTFIIVAACVVLFYVFCQIRSPKQAMLSLAAIAVLGVLIIVFINQNPLFVQGFDSRFTDETMGTVGHRTVLGQNQWAAFIRMPRCMLLGAGVTQYAALLGAGSIHNMLLQILICYGFPFALVFLGAIFKPVWDELRSPGQAVMWIPLIGVVIFVQTIQFINPYHLMLPFAMAVYALQNKSGCGTKSLP